MSGFGETWRGWSTVGLEDPDNPGLAVTATRRTYFTNVVPPDPGRETRYHSFSTGTRERRRAVTVGPYMPTFSVTQELSPSESIELFLATVQGDVTPTTPMGGTLTRDWAFGAADPDPAKYPDYQTHEVDDAVRAWIASGCQGSQLSINGSANAANTIQTQYMALDLQPGTMAPGLDERTPEFVEGWETQLWLDGFGDTPGTTQISDLLNNWQITIANGQQRKFTARNSNSALGLRMGEFMVTARCTFEAASDSAIDAYTDSITPTLAVVRFRFGDNHVIEGAFNSYVQLDIAGAWHVDSLGAEDAGTRTYSLTLTNVYEPDELAASFAAVLRTDRTAAYD